MTLTMSLSMLKEDRRVIQGMITPMASRVVGLLAEVSIVLEVGEDIITITSMDILDRLITYMEEMMPMIMDSIITRAKMIGSRNTLHMVEDVEDIMGIPSTIDPEAAGVESISLRSTKSMMMARVSLPVQDLVEGMAAAGEDDHAERLQVNLLAMTIAV